MKLLEFRPYLLWKAVSVPAIQPIRAELFSVDRLEQFAERLSADHQLTRSRFRRRPLLRRVKANGRVLRGVYKIVSQVVESDRVVVPAVEWLVDNFHVVQEQIREIRDDLPPGFYRRLPVLAAGNLAGHPRVYALAWSFIEHTDSHLDPQWLRRYIVAYQKAAPLETGEIWAFSICLRMVLIENLRRLSERIVRDRAARAKADRVADQALGMVKNHSSGSGSPALNGEPPSRALMVQLLHRLRDPGPAQASLWDWLEKALAAQNTSAEALIAEEHQDQSAANATVRNIITSMRLLTSMDWARFFEDVSVSEQALRTETNFGNLDFGTRDLYRHAIEEVARRSPLTELEVTQRLVAISREAKNRPGKIDSAEQDRRSDPGYFLISDGRPAFEASVGYRLTWRNRIVRRLIGRATALYLGSVGLATAAFLAVPVALALDAGAPPGRALLFALLAALPASELAIAIVNRLAADLFVPKSVPKMDFSTGIPRDSATLLVVPTLLTSKEALEDQLTQLEVLCLGNSDGFIQFALVTDWTDAVQELTEADDVLLASAREGIERLNQRHGPSPEGFTRFHLLHRRRLWNPSEGAWIGWERKRGKLEELNRLLRGEMGTTFITAEKNRSELIPGIRYVITLDADTRMLRGTACRLVGAMAHPLHRPSLDSRARRVTAGYGVMQPRIMPVLPSAGAGSIFQRVYSWRGGIDPYAFAVSDTYQDVFKEGSYAGKGIYDVDAFRGALQGRIPGNRLLSHDLYEGLFARAALLSDVELFEEFPSDYLVCAARSHRWIRGDWQLLPRFFGAGLPVISLWKIFDNLRRSLLAPAAFLLLIAAAWSRAGQIWPGFLAAVTASLIFLPWLLGLLSLPRKASIRHHLRQVAKDLAEASGRMIFWLLFLPHEAWVASDAIARALWRMAVTKKHLLEWVSYAQTKTGGRMGSYYAQMAMHTGLAAGSLAGLAAAGSIARPEGVVAAIWALAPWIAFLAGRPSLIETFVPLSEEDRWLLRRIARKTWRFFETFVTAETNYLPPDNFQESPRPVVAMRTSPTNIGLYLLSILTARDFGWAGLLDTLDRFEQTTKTMQALARHRGHLYNWYDVKNLRPLEPLYVSTVDSGNFAGHLWTLGNACREMMESPVLRLEILEGLKDALYLAMDAARRIENRRADAVTAEHWRLALAGLDERLENFPNTVGEWRSLLTEIQDRAETLLDMARTLAAGETAAEVEAWSELVLSQVKSHVRDLDAFWPAAELGAAATLAELAERSAEGDAAGGRAAAAVRRLRALDELVNAEVERMEFRFLFDPWKKMFSIGFLPMEGKLDPSFYDMLASEARLASFVAIAKGEIPETHWFRLSRIFTPSPGGLVLLSWSGSMFEYLMPTLVLDEPAGSLIEQTNRRAVRRQERYGRERALPWGISESAYNVRDFELTYQYSSFGVPDLAFKRGLEKDRVVAPYATALAAMFEPGMAADNFRRLAKLGAEGIFGFYEAVDFTPSRVPDGQDFAIVEAYMAHHQGMSLVSICNVLKEGRMRARFHAEPAVQATQLLLQERLPRLAPLARVQEEPEREAAGAAAPPPALSRRFQSPFDSPPKVQVLSNGRYSVMLTAAGGGYSHWRDLAVTRWREDPTRDAYGTFIFVRDLASGEIWSAAHQPTGVAADRYSVDFADDRAVFSRQDGALVTTMEVVVSTEDDAEIRRIGIKNAGSRAREVEITSYAEIVLVPPAADAAHPAFSNLFVETEFVGEVGGLLCSRRPRSAEEPMRWAAHVIASNRRLEHALQYETDRARFLGRGRSISTPMSVIDGGPLTNTAGAVLDPIFSLRQKLRIEPGETVHVSFTTMVAGSREEALTLADKYHDGAMFERMLALAWTQSQVQRHYLGAEPAELHLFQELAGRILYADRGMRASETVLQRNDRGASGLWAHGISGDLPILLVRIDEPEDREIVRQLLRAREYWRMKNLALDLVILNEKAGSYQQDLQNVLENLAQAGRTPGGTDSDRPRGGVYLLRADRIAPEDRTLLLAAARVVLLSRQGTLADQLARQDLGPEPRPAPAPRLPAPPAGRSELPQLERLEFFNGLGGFSENGREYRVALGAGQWTPAPWVNVIANPHFGFLVSECGAGYTWSGNSRENKLTPWSNDPVGDPPGEIMYVRDEETGEVWTPTALPIRQEARPYRAAHGHGYSRFEHESHGIALELTLFVPVEDPIKISRLVIQNRSGRARRLSVTAYAEWVLGVNRQESAPYIVTELDSETGAIFARNPWNTEFGARTAFADLAGKQSHWTADRREFLGRNGRLDHPALLEDAQPFSRSAGAGLDPCAALQRSFFLPAGGKAEVVFFLGQAAGPVAARELIRRWRATDLNTALIEVRDHWERVFGAVQVRTPERAMDILLNSWLLYQVVSCRLWARAGFYQAGGAYGFRDQLQDAMAVVVARRDWTRDQILRAASRQFPEGDVQHWWHEPTGRGVRTRITDDRIWLPYVVAHYLEVTGDTGILDERLTFLEGKGVPEGQEDTYFLPGVSSESASLFEHCARALELSLAVGPHGLPLMGSGDWNDGMNRVGVHGKGESVWLAWFLHTTLWEFAKIAEAKGETTRAQTWRLHVGELKAAVERSAWDGKWYRRAFFDDGTPLGTAGAPECQIDSIAQSWSVLSGGADPARSVTAMASAAEHLLRREEQIALLLDPPFNQSKPSPGYIQGYLPGVRENGGQYTHAAAWMIMALAAQADGDKAEELFRFLNPIHHGSSRAGIQRYKTEPYVTAGDVYSVAPHAGRGGWTWYTGSAGWLYRAGIESLLGFRLRGTTAFIDPVIPKSWNGFDLDFRYHSTHYEVRVENPHHVSRGIQSAALDSHPVRGSAAIRLVDDGKIHRLHIVLGPS